MVRWGQSQPHLRSRAVRPGAPCMHAGLGAAGRGGASGARGWAWAEAGGAAVQLDAWKPTWPALRMMHGTAMPPLLLLPLRCAGAL